MAAAVKGSSLNLVQGLLARRFLLRVFMLISAMATFPFLFVSKIDLMEFFSVDSPSCISSHSFAHGKYLKPFAFYALPLLGSPYGPSPCQVDVNFTYAVFRALMDVNLLSSGSKALCVGEKSGAAATALRKLGFPDALKADRGHFSVLQRKGLVDELAFEDNSFDFVFSRGLNRASVPALHVLEIERVLRPGGIGAVLEVVANADPRGMIKAATPVSSFIKCSDIVYVGMIDGFALAVFKKKIDSLSSFEHLQLPKECPSVANNKPFTKFLEPLLDNVRVESELKVAYLSKFMSISSRRQLVYIDVGAGGYANSSIAKWFLPQYPKQSRRLDIYALDHDSSVLTSYARRHDVTFVYYPALSKNKPAIDYDPLEESSASFFDDDDEPEMFDFLSWFKETVGEGNFVVLKMNAGGVGLRNLLELLESGAVCMVDELFLQCPDSVDAGDATSGNCLQLFKALRRMGIYAHQWP